MRALVDGPETKVRAAADAVQMASRKIAALGEPDGLQPTADIEGLFTVKDYL
ncbi:hypothetical protein GCM10010191_20590 [Actinomadura vinacea]|uniref:Uncharacterized protein n=1 Tax=Actinomadura vinacea TaxID=115336 RepID=A0ABN3IQG7_9ACTN